MHHFAAVLLFNRIDQGDLVINDQVGVVGGAAVGGVAVEITGEPVNGPNPVNSWRQFDLFHAVYLLLYRSGLKSENGISLFYII